MENLKFSVILPVYNVAPFLEECLQSLINQSYSNLEILCVNDGSPDNSLEILQKYAALDARIKVFDRENQGSGRSRNFGIEQSSGDYLSFIDPDDWIDRDMYKKLYDLLLKNLRMWLSSSTRTIMTPPGKSVPADTFRLLLTGVV